MIAALVALIRYDLVANKTLDPVRNRKRCFDSDATHYDAIRMMRPVPKALAFTKSVSTRGRSAHPPSTASKASTTVMAGLLSSRLGERVPVSDVDTGFRFAQRLSVTFGYPVALSLQEAALFGPRNNPASI
ncbi:MAG: hypothetical protein ACT6R2_05340 [Blastomonas fulva]|uniref:hypothetical protein n=1 Tax=Blastomonas TaxID=150203 RepID=UPI0014961003|nr:hypothetical protein [Blastomonas sp. RAC04]